MTYNIILALIMIIFFHYFYKLFKRFNCAYSSGAGSILPIVLFVSIFYYSPNLLLNYKFFIFFLSILTIIYFYDDFRKLNINFRFFLQFLSGFVCFYLISDFNQILNNDYLIIYSIIFGLWNIFLVNLINFYDGNDLNVSILIIVILSFLFFFNNINDFINNLIFINLLLIIIFCFYNHFYPNYYFGDSGCFAFANILNFFILVLLKDSSVNYELFITVFYLPVIDVLCVIFYRLLLKESLYTRNYYHLYQRIASNFTGYWYVAPTIAFPIFFSLLNYILINFYKINNLIVLIINIPILIILYFIILKVIISHSNVK